MMRRTLMALLLTACEAGLPHGAYTEMDAMPPSAAAETPRDAGTLLEVPMAPPDAFVAPPPPPPDASTDPLAAFEGVYAARLVLQATSTAPNPLPLGGDPTLEVPGQVVSYGITTLLRDADGNPTLEEEPCFAELRTDSDQITLSIEATAVRQDAPLVSAIELNPASGWARPSNTLPLGWRPTRPDDPLPDDLQDARVSDPDLDNQPGVTIIAEADSAFGPQRCQLLTLQALRTRYTDGWFDAEGLAGATVADESSEVRTLEVVGENCSQDVQTRVHGTGGLQLKRIDEGAAECGQWTRASLAALFDD